MRLESGASPPRPALAFRVGVTGHRRLKPAALGRLREEIAGLLAAVSREVAAVQAADAQVYSPEPARLSVASQLAVGADQLAARIALDQGFTHRAILPLGVRAYRMDFEGADAHAFDELLGLSDHVWRVPANRDSREHCYALAGEATVAQSDVLLAVWDGEAARGRGGTAEVVDYAIRRGVPVLHLDAGGELPARALWSALGGLSPQGLDRRNAPARPLTEATLRDIVTALLAPPAEEEERHDLTLFLKERAPRVRLRLEYPLLLALTGVQALRRRHVITQDYLRATEADWRSFFSHPLAGTDGTRQGLAGLEQAFAWADGLGDHFAQSYRGALTFNYAAAALAVMMALVGILAPRAGFALQAGELLAVLLLIGNTNLGNSRAWHRRWLDYRFLAEQLRPMRSLALLGVAIPERYVHTRAAPPDRWTDWYAAAIWRGIGPPPPIPDSRALKGLVEHLTHEDVDEQVAYNVRAARRMHELDHRLHLVGTALFYVTTGLSIAALIAFALHSSVPHTEARTMTFLSATLPTIAAAVFGIRGQGDFEAASGRAAETAERLARVAAQLREHPADIVLASRGFEDAAQIMLADLGDWHVSYRHRKLVIPG